MDAPAPEPAKIHLRNQMMKIETEKRASEIIGMR